MNRNKKTIVSIILLTIAVVICFFGYNENDKIRMYSFDKIKMYK